MFKVILGEKWDIHFQALDKSVQDRIIKRIQRLEYEEKNRHLKHGLPFFVVEAGQYRICYEEKESMRKIIFVGNHKQYEKWLKNFEANEF